VGDTQTILCVNGGSSSLKFHVYEMGFGDVGRSEQLLVRGAVEGIGHVKGRIWFADGQGTMLVDRLLDQIQFEGAVDHALAALSSGSLPSIEAIGHRVVHGGPGHRAPRLITLDVMNELRDHAAWAPLHMPVILTVIEALDARRPAIPQVACFDTGFHERMPEVAKRLPLPGKFYDQGIRKYGFHGLSYEYVLAALGREAAGRLVVAHLGSGCSMAACLDGEPVDTTMGMTPAGGMMMGTRTGDMDPGVLLYLLREWGYNEPMLDRLVSNESGLRGVSGKTSDMEKLLELRATGDAAAAMAVEMFCYQARKTIGSLAAALGGLDKLVFTAGIGENAPFVRALICRGLEHLGVNLDPAKNKANSRIISTKDSACKVSVIRTNEDLMIARHTHTLVFGGGSAI